MRTVVKLLTGSACAAGMLFGGCANQTDADPSGVGTAYAELAKAVQDCADEQRACIQAAAGDVAGLDACRASFQACADSEAQAPEEALSDAANQCVQEAKACRAQSDDKRSCQQAMRGCLGVGGGDQSGPASDADGGLPGQGGQGTPQGGADRPQAAECHTEMRTCIEQGGVPRECAASVRECVTTAVGGGKPTDAEADGDATEEDATEEDATDEDVTEEDTTESDEVEDDDAVQGGRPDVTGQGRGGPPSL